jgi:hypothetical protein
MELRKDRIEPVSTSGSGGGEEHKEKPFEHAPQDATGLQQEVIQHQPAKEAMQNKLAENPENTPWVTTTTTTTRTSRTNVTSTATSNPFTETYTTTVTVQKDLNSDK